MEYMPSGDKELIRIPTKKVALSAQLDLLNNCERRGGESHSKMLPIRQGRQMPPFLFPPVQSMDYAPKHR
jgi:hypothetical protein